MLKFLVKADGILHDVCAAVRTEVVESAYLGNTPGAELVATSKCHLELPRTIRIAAHRAGFSRCECSGRTTCTSLNPSERQLTGVAEIQPHKVCERGLHGAQRRWGGCTPLHMHIHIYTLKPGSPALFLPKVLLQSCLSLARLATHLVNPGHLL